jgi:Skp family chaperone for outer membrane proteins
MNLVSKFSTLIVGIATLASTPSMLAQAAGPQAPAAAAPAAVQPQAIPAKIALIAFEQAVFATNEGQKAIADVQKKYDPTRTKITAAEAEVESLQKQLQGAANLSEEDRASRVRTIDAKQKQLQRDGEDASAAYQADLQEAYGKIAQKFNAVMQKYMSDNGYTLGMDVSANQQQSSVLFAAPQTDVTRAVVDAYNASSGVPVQPAAGPSPAPRATTPRPATAPRK